MDAHVLLSGPGGGRPDMDALLKSWSRAGCLVHYEVCGMRIDRHLFCVKEQEIVSKDMSAVPDGAS
jgi:hypothetical protein